MHTFRQFRVEVIGRQKLSKCHITGIQFHLRVCRTEKEPGGVQSVGVEVWEYGVDQLFQTAVSVGVGYVFNGKQHMEFGSWYFAIFFAHMERL